MIKKHTYVDVCAQRASTAFFAFQRLRLRRLVTGFEQRDFHSTPSCMKVSRTQRSQSPAFTQLPCFTQGPPLSNLSFCLFSAFYVLSLFYFSTICASLALSAISPSLYPRLLGHCVLFPGFSSCLEGGVMGKALLSLLGLS